VEGVDLGLGIRELKLPEWMGASGLDRLDLGLHWRGLGYYVQEVWTNGCERWKGCNVEWIYWGVEVRERQMFVRVEGKFQVGLGSPTTMGGNPN